MSTATVNALGAVNTVGLAGLAISQMAMQARLDALKADDAGGLGMPTFVDGSAAPSGNGSEVRPFRTLDEAAAKINLDGAGFAALTGTPAELATAGAPARIYLAAGTYVQTKPFTAPAVVIPAPGAVVPALFWTVPPHTSTATGVPWASGVFVDKLNGIDLGSVGDLVVVTNANTAGSWAVGLEVTSGGKFTSTVPTVNSITTSGPLAVEVVVDRADIGAAITMDAGNLHGTSTNITGNVAVAAGSMDLDEVTIAGLASAAGISPGIIARDSELNGGVTGDVRANGSVISGVITGDAELIACNVVGITAINGDVPFIDTDTWAQLRAVGVTPAGTTTLFGVTGGSVAAGVSPQVVLFGVTFPTTPSGVSVSAQAVAVDATTFAGITNKNSTSITVAFGGVGAAAPTVLHWTATLG